MKKIDLEKFFKSYDEGASHHIAAVHILEAAMPDELLDKESEWVVCFEAVYETDPVKDNYNSDK
tara:strand:+ start:3069 stop:3260 length:192 start_codon:yes stop_codon:yes gene_type:complete